MNYYHDMVIGKSWRELQALRQCYDFILIGGWAVWLWTQALKSKDIDVVLDYAELEKLKNDFELQKNDRLKKYEARKEMVEIDIYVPFYSNPGVPAEEIKNFSRSIGGFVTASKEVLAVLKQRALLERAHTVKGRKDLIDLVSLFLLRDFAWKEYRKVVTEYHRRDDFSRVKQLIRETTHIEELGLNVHSMARFKKKIMPLMVV